MNKKLFFIFFFVISIIPHTIVTSPIVGFELNYIGDLTGNGNFSGAITCAYDTKRERLQAKIDFKNNTIQPNFLVIPIQCKQTNYEANQLLATIINTNFTIATLIYEKEIVRKIPNLQLQEHYIKKIRQEIEKGNDLVEKNNREFYL